MPRLPRIITASELARGLAREGWYVVRQDGSHVQFKHSVKRGRVTIAIHAGAMIKPKTLLSALNQAGLTVEELRRLL